MVYNVIKMKIIGIIPARKGSKGLPGKNLIIWKGKSLLEHTIIHLKKTKLHLLNQINNKHKTKTTAINSLTNTVFLNVKHADSLTMNMTILDFL